MNEDVIKAIEEAVKEKKLSCIKAHEISKEHKVSLRDIGKYCNENRIKIIVCELGCF